MPFIVCHHCPADVNLHPCRVCGRVVCQRHRLAFDDEQVWGPEKESHDSREPSDPESVFVCRDCAEHAHAFILDFEAANTAHQAEKARLYGLWREAALKARQP